MLRTKSQKGHRRCEGNNKIISLTSSLYQTLQDLESKSKTPFLYPVETAHTMYSEIMETADCG